MATQEQIDSFYRFATEQLAGGSSEKSIDELYVSVIKVIEGQSADSDRDRGGKRKNSPRRA